MKCAERKFPTSIVNSIMQYKALNPHIPALRWGTQKEDQAKIDYKLEMEKIHSDFQIHAAGTHRDEYWLCNECTERLNM